MGFECSFDVYDKYDRDLSVKEIKAVRCALCWEKETETFQKHCSFEKYAENWGCTEPIDPAVVAFYKDHQKKDEYGNTNIYSTIEFWCSSGYHFYKKVLELFPGRVEKNSSEEEVVLGKDDIILILKNAWEWLKEMSLEPCELTYAFKYVETEYEDIQDITLMHCDGIEVEFDDGAIRRIDANPDWGDFLAPKKDFDQDVYWTIQSLIDTCIKILTTIDFDKQFVVFGGGW